MKKYFFTFGQSHYSLKGEPMSPYWVIVTATDYNAARSHFCMFANELMGSPTKWAFQYTEDDFNSEYFPGGEYKHLHLLIKNQ